MAESDVKPVSGQRTVEVLPSASRLTESLRDIGYDYVTAVADVVDNSVTAGARNVRIQVDFAGRESRIIIVDDGAGMSPRVLDEAMRFGSRRAYKSKDLGKFGLGLKTASLSQGRRLSVLTRSAPTTKRISARVLDLDWVDYADKWEVLVPRASEFDPVIRNELSAGPGTVVVWELLDRILSYRDPDSHWARRKFERLPGLAAEYLGMVFHRFLDGEVEGRPSLEISINDEPVQSWNPFALSERATKEMPAKSFNLRVGSRAGRVTLRPFILPSRSSFSSQHRSERRSGPKHRSPRSPLPPAGVPQISPRQPLSSSARPRLHCSVRQSDPRGTPGRRADTVQTPASPGAASARLGATPASWPR